jgi:Protein of unknown function (DUF2793)
MPEITDRLELPLLSAGQAQKELTHNDALTRLAMVVQPVVQTIAPAAVPASPQPGQCWIVGNAATGAWLGKDGCIACWTQGGWRFAAPFEGMQVWSLADNVPAVRTGGTWEIGMLRASAVKIAGVQVLGPRQAAISAPAGGSTIDAEARTAITAMLTTLRTHGLIAT